MKISGFSLIVMFMALDFGAVAMARDATTYTVVFDPISLALDTNSTIHFTASLQNPGFVDELDLILLQTSTPPNPANVVFLVDVRPGICILPSDMPKTTCLSSQIHLTPGNHTTLEVGLKKAPGFSSNDSTNGLFFCFASIRDTQKVCQYYSTVFGLSDNGQGSGGNNLAPFLSQITVTSTATNILSLMQPQTSVTSFPSIATQVTTSAEPTIFTATTVTTTPTASSFSPSGPDAANTNKPVVTHAGGGLSVGAKVGIALGALVIFALLLLGLLFCLRRKHAKRSAHRALSPHQPPEQVMLTRSMHTDSFGASNGSGSGGGGGGGGGGGRNAIMAEKEEALTSTVALNQNNNLNSASSSPIHETETRHSAVAPYVPLPSLPYSGTATTIPRRKPTSATVASTVSRNLSSASALSSGPISPRSQTTSRSDDFSPYHDVPVYGDARHSPQVFTGGERNLGGASSPFVTEEMSPEEAARLEEEERRIDAAIAEAERR